jgi:hypothetical protein
MSTEHTEQQSNRAIEYSVGHVTYRSAVLAAGRNERRYYLTFCLRPYYKLVPSLPTSTLSLTYYRASLPLRVELPPTRVSEVYRFL